VDIVEICNVYVGKMVIITAKRIFNSDKICHSYSDLNFGVTFLEHSVVIVHHFLYSLMAFDCQVIKELLTYLLTYLLSSLVDIVIASCFKQKPRGDPNVFPQDDFVM